MWLKLCSDTFAKEKAPFTNQEIHANLSSFQNVSFFSTPQIGLIPIAGDAITLAIAMRLIHTAQKADIPKSLTHQMLFNVALDFGVSFIS
jgi:hypothetical protein